MYMAARSDNSTPPTVPDYIPQVSDLLEGKQPVEPVNFLRKFLAFVVYAEQIEVLPSFWRVCNQLRWMQPSEVPF